MDNNTNPEENQKIQNYFKMGLGVLLLIAIISYKMFNSSDEDTTYIEEDIRIYKEDDFIQTKYTGKIEPELEEIRQSIRQIQKENKELKEENKKLQMQPSYGIKAQSDFPGRNKTNLYKNYPVPPYRQDNADKPSMDSINTFETTKITMLTNTLMVEKTGISEEPPTDSGNSEKKIKIYIPSGSILKLKLLSKIHANTLSKAASTPVPALFKVMDLAILPNRASLDIRECFVKTEARGSMSSESVYVRSNFLSCVTNSGKIIDSKINGAAIIPGTVISKQGALLGLSFIAGFVDGWAKISQGQYTTTMANAVGVTQSFQTSGEVAGYSGLSNASSNLGNFYMDMVKNIEPVIEVLAGQDIDMMITEGSYLTLKEDKDEKNINK